MGKHRDWTEIERDYRENGLSYATLAKKYNVPLDTLKKAAARQGWTQRREKKQRKEQQKLKSAETAIAAAEQEMAPNGTSETAPNGTEKMAPAIVILDAEDPETRFNRMVNGMMDRVERAIEIVPPEAVQAIKLLTGALKDLRTLQRLDKDALDIEEQRARIEKLRSETRIVEPDRDNRILVEFVDTEGAES